MLNKDNSAQFVVKGSNPTPETRTDTTLIPPPADFHGAALIDEQGREIPITEQMVQQACRQMD